MADTLKLSSIVSTLNEVDFSNTKKILSLTNDVVLLTENIDNSYASSHLTNKILNFTQASDTYVEIGAKYGDLSFQIISKLEEGGKAYLFEASRNFYNLLKHGIFLNGLENIWVENTEDLVHIGMPVNIIRLNNGASLCETISKIDSIIKHSPELKIFVNWQRELLNTKESPLSIERCLSNFKENGLVFFDILQDINICNYKSYQLSPLAISKATNIEFIATREDVFEKNIEDLTDETKREECLPLSWNKSLFSAAENGLFDDVKKYVEKDVDINFVSHEGGTALYIAAQKGYTDIVKYLIQNKANLEIKSTHKMPPLYVAVVNRHFEVAELLLKAGASTESDIPGGYTALCVASYYGYKDFIELLLDYGAKISPDLINKDVIQIAQDNGHSEVEEFILNYKNKKQNIINNELFVATQIGNFTKAEEQIINGADVNAVHEVGATPLFISSQNGVLAIVEILLQNGAKTEISWQRQTPLFIAAHNNHIKIVEKLLQAGADTEANNGHTTALYLAITKDNVEIVELLLKHKANTEVRIGEYTPLSLSVYNGKTEMVSLLLEHGSDNKIQIEGFNMLYIAAKRGFSDIAELLLKSGLDIQEGQINGKTALDVAAENGHFEVVKLLLSRGANIGKSQKHIFNLFQENNSDDIELSLKDKLINKFLEIILCIEDQHLLDSDYLEICGINNASFIASEYEL
jgi:ankyrin repeat protein